MPFDPSQPFTIESEPETTGFDPNKPFTVESEPEPKLGPSELVARARLAQTKNLTPESVAESFTPGPAAKRIAKATVDATLLGQAAKRIPALQETAKKVEDLNASMMTPGGIAMIAGGFVQPELVAGLGAAMSIPAVTEGLKEASAGIETGDISKTLGGATEAGLGVAGVGLGAMGVARLLPRTTAELSKMGPAPIELESGIVPLERRLPLRAEAGLTRPGIEMPEAVESSLIPEERQLAAPRIILPEFAPSSITLDFPETAPPSRQLAAPRRIMPEFMPPGEMQLAPIARETVTSAEGTIGAPAKAPINLSEQAEGIAALKKLISLTEEKKSVGQPYKPPTVSVDLRQLEGLMQRNTVSKVESWADQVIGDKLREAGANPFLDPEFMAAAATKGAILFKRGVTTFAEWSSAMREQFGRGMDAQLPTIFEQSKKYWEGKTPAEVKTSPAETVKPVTESSKVEPSIAAVEDAPKDIAAPAANPVDASLSSTDAPVPQFVGIKNARVDMQRADRGLPPLMDPARKADSVLWDSAMKRIEADPALPDRLVRELTETPRPMTDEETVIIERRLMELTNDLDQARWEGIKASDAGDVAKAAEMEAKAGEISDALTVVEQAVGRQNEGGVGAGTLMGRALRARQLLIREDFSLGGLERAKREAKGFQPLSDADKIEISNVEKQFRTLNEKLQDRLKKRIAAYEEKIAKGDFTTKQRPKLPDDPEINRLSLELDKVKKRWYEGLVEEKMKRRSNLQKAVGGFTESLNAMRAILTSADFSALLRQGKFIVLSHPIRASKAVPAMLKSMFSEQAAYDVNRAIEQSPNYRLMRASKLFLADHGVQLSKMEEQYMSRWASKIPGVGKMVAGSERAYTTFLNKLRADSFDAMANSLGRDGKITLEQGRILANFINVATGRGTIGMADQAAVGLNTVFFAPRFVASRFQMLLGQPLYYGLLSGKAPFSGKGAGAARLMVAKEYARILGGAATVYTLGKLAGAEIETDPRSSDFGKMKWGHTRIDPMAGVNQVTVLLSKVASGESKSLRTGAIRPLRAETGRKLPYGAETTFDVAARFTRLKLAPAPGLILNVATGTDAIGQRVTAGTIAKDAVVPISLQDIATQMKNEGWPQNTIYSVLSIFGETVQNFDETQRKH